MTDESISVYPQVITNYCKVFETSDFQKMSIYAIDPVKLFYIKCIKIEKIKGVINLKEVSIKKNSVYLFCLYKYKSISTYKML